MWILETPVCWQPCYFFEAAHLLQMFIVPRLRCDRDLEEDIQAYTHQYNIEKISRFLGRAQAVAMQLMGALNVCGQK